MTKPTNPQVLTISLGTTRAMACADSLPPRLRTIMVGQHATREQRDWVGSEVGASTAEIHSHEPVLAVDLVRTHWVGTVPNTGLTSGEPASPAGGDLSWSPEPHTRLDSGDQEETPCQQPT